MGQIAVGVEQSGAGFPVGHFRVDLAFVVQAGV